MATTLDPGRARSVLSRGTGPLVAAGVVLLPLVCVPGLEHPFSTPKLWLLAALDALVVLHYVSRPKNERWAPSWPWLAWTAAVALSAATAPTVPLAALLVVLLPLPLWAAPLVSARPIAIASAVESLVVLLQFAGHDPLAWFGWRAESFANPRMLAYGTLGNPDFVAAWLSATLPLCAVWPARVARPAVVLQLAALICTGSRVTLIAVPVAALVAILARRRNGPTGNRSASFATWAALGIAAALAVVWLSPARPLGTTARGRLYLARATLVHALDVPPSGLGPGAFVRRFPEWRQAWLKNHRADRAFAGPVDHAHNDYVEYWVEFGPLGAFAFVVLCGWALRAGWRGGAPDFVLAAFCALLAVALVDFPLHRPAESALVALLGCFLTRRISPCPVRPNA